MHTQAVVHLGKGAGMNNEQEMEKWFGSQPPMLSDIHTYVYQLLYMDRVKCMYVHFSIVCMHTPQ